MVNIKAKGAYQSLDGYIPKVQYPSQFQTMRAEQGSIQEVRILASSQGPVEQGASMLGRDVYDLIIAGLEAYTVIKQSGMSSEFIYLPPQFSGPTAQNVTLAWKAAFSPQITNDEWILRLRFTL